MALVDIATKQISEPPAADAVRAQVAGIVQVVDMKLLQIRNLVRDHTSSAVLTELGRDGADLPAVYAKLREALEIAGGKTVEDLPK